MNAAHNSELQRAIESLIRTEGRKRYNEEFIPKALADLCETGHLIRGTPAYEKAGGLLYLMGSYMTDYADTGEFISALEDGEIGTVP